MKIDVKVNNGSIVGKAKHTVIANYANNNLKDEINSINKLIKSSELELEIQNKTVELLTKIQIALNNESQHEIVKAKKRFVEFIKEIGRSGAKIVSILANFATITSFFENTNIF